jgi:hypothetical protein
MVRRSDDRRQATEGKSCSLANLCLEGQVMRDYRDLIVWKRSHQLTLTVYAETRSFPREELYGLTGQVRRSCSSIPSNIAEG